MDLNLEGDIQQVSAQNTHKLNAIPSGKDPKRNYWKAEEEQLLKDWADKAQCYEWMHLRSHIQYKARNAWFTIPVIIISTITGTANFAQDRFSDTYKPWVVMGVGAFNIFAGIITTIYQFLKISELSEGHRVSALYWGKFYRNLKTELAKHPLDRSNHESIITNAKEEYDRLLEMSPMVAQSVIQEFNRKYGGMAGFTRPEIVTTRFGTDIYSMTDMERKAMVEELLADKIAIEKAKEAELAKARETTSSMVQQLDELRSQLEEVERARELAKQEAHDALIHAEEASKYMKTLEAIQEQPQTPVKQEEDPALIKFRETFLNINGRAPTDQEVKTIFKSMYDSPAPSPGKGNSMLDMVFAELGIPDINPSSLIVPSPLQINQKRQSYSLNPASIVEIDNNVAGKGDISNV